MEVDRPGLRLAAGAGYQQGTFLRYNQRTHPPRLRNVTLAWQGSAPYAHTENHLLVTRIER